MLTIRKTRTFKRTIKVRIASPTTPDAFDEGSFIATFKAMTRSEIEAAQTRAAASAKAVAAGDNKPAANDRDFLRSILVGAEGLGDEDGNPLEPLAARDAVIEDLALCLPAIEAFNEQYSRAKAGN